MNLGVRIANTQCQPVTAKTDANGRYHLQGIAAGYYLVWPRALAYAMPVEELTGRPGRTVNIGDSIELTAGEQETRLKIVMVYGSGTIRGQLTVVNGSLRPDLQISVFATPLQSGAKVTPRSAQVDAQGKFVIEGLAPGEYELRPFI